MIFRVLETFHSNDLESDYCEGLLYRIDDMHSPLAFLAAGWLADGKIILVDQDNAARASGTGVVLSGPCNSFLP